MGFSTDYRDGTESETSMLMHPHEIPKDSFHLSYIVYFTLGAGYLLPWNAFITAVDYFSYLYPDASVDRVFAVTYMVVGLVFLLFLVGSAHRTGSYVRINAGLGLFIVALLVVPVMDLVYVKGRRGLYTGYYVTCAAVALSGIADALVQGSMIGSAGELPNRYMQATVAGTAASGVLVSVMRIITKSVFSQDPHGLRSSANLYFGVSIVFMAICLVCYNIVDKLPVIQYYKNCKNQAMATSEDVQKTENSSKSGCSWRSSLWDTVGTIKWFGFGLFLIYVVTLSIFPGYITEDVHSQILKDWYSIILITGYNVFDLVGKSLTAVYVIENAKIAITGTVARLLFYPLFLGCLHCNYWYCCEASILSAVSWLFAWAQVLSDRDPGHIADMPARADQWLFDKRVDDSCSKGCSTTAGRDCRDFECCFLGSGAGSWLYCCLVLDHLR